MVDEHVGRRRRRRRGRRGRGGRPPLAPEERVARAQPEPRAEPALPDWRWRTFPVFLAFAAGGVVMGLLAASALALPYFFVVLFGVAFGVAHIITRTIVARRRRS